MSTLPQALRALRRAPAFTLTAVLLLALGIGLATAVFTIANAIVVRRLPVADQDRLVLLSGEAQGGRGGALPLTLADVRDLERTSRTLAGVAFYEFRGAVPAPIQAGDDVCPLQLGMVSGNFFDVLGSRALLGRTLRAADEVAGAAPVVVLGYRAWRQRFGGDSGILLFETSPTDGGTLALIAALLLAVAALASLAPARLSMRADPVAALRAEG